MADNSTIQESHAFVLEQARLNVAFVKADAKNVEQAKQINAALANIVAMERNVVMRDALERAKLKDQHEGLQDLLEH